MKKILVSIVAAGLLFGTSLSASEATKAASRQAVTEAKLKAEKQNKEVKIVKEAVEAVALTNEVLADLDKGNKDEAIKKIEKAIGKLEVVMAAPKAPALIPIDSSVEIATYPGSVKDIEVALITVKALLKNNKVQEARRLLNTLRSEIVVKTINLPLASYPSALKLAAKFLHEDRIDEAKNILNQALLTFVEVDVVTPIPLLAADKLIKDAQTIAKKDKKKALDYLKAAKENLKKAEALGYVSESETTYKMLEDSIEKIEKEIKGKNEPEKLFEDLIKKLKEFKDKAVKIINK